MECSHQVLHDAARTPYRVPLSVRSSRPSITGPLFQPLPSWHTQPSAPTRPVPPDQSSWSALLGPLLSPTPPAPLLPAHPSQHTPPGPHFQARPSRTAALGPLSGLPARPFSAPPSRPVYLGTASSDPPFTASLGTPFLASPSRHHSPGLPSQFVPPGPPLPSRSSRPGRPAPLTTVLPAHSSRPAPSGMLAASRRDWRNRRCGLSGIMFVP